MSRKRFDLKFGLQTLGLLAGVVLLAGKAAAEVIVLSSNTPGIVPRTELKDDHVLKLETGEEVNLLLRSGGKSERTRHLSGPFEGPVRGLYKNKGVADVVYETIRDMWITGGRDSKKPTGTRDAVPVGSKNWRAIRVVAQGAGQARYCFEKGSAPPLTRGLKMDGKALRITDSKTQSNRVEANWPTGQGELAWPSALPAKNDGAYTITNSGVVIEVTLQEVEPGSFEGQRALETLAEHKCTDQLDGWLGENG